MPDQVSIGRQIRELRRSRGLTLTQLAEKVGRSISTLSEMERGRAAITIQSLNAIAQALNVSMNWFFSGNAVAPAEERDVVVRRRNRRVLNLGGAGTTEELLSPNLNGPLELILTTFAPGAGTGESGRYRKGDEAGLVQSGTLELHVDGHTYVLEAGDSFALKSGGVHWCRNPGTVDAVIVWAITPANY